MERRREEDGAGDEEGGRGRERGGDGSQRGTGARGATTGSHTTCQQTHSRRGPRCLFGRCFGVRYDTYNHPDRTLKHNFLTYQCFDHMLLACCQSILLILYFRDHVKDADGVAGKLPCTGLARTGSDCCESCFSMCGGFGAYVDSS